MPSTLTLLPPILAIGIALWKREVILALMVSLFSSELILLHGHVFTAFVQVFKRIFEVFSDAGNIRILIFSLLIGGLIALVRDSGGAWRCAMSTHTWQIRNYLSFIYRLEPVRKSLAWRRKIPDSGPIEQRKIGNIALVPEHLATLNKYGRSLVPIDRLVNLESGPSSIVIDGQLLKLSDSKCLMLN